MLPLLLLLLTACGHAAANASDGCVPSAVKTVYVVCTSHIDTGFDHPIDEMERWCKRIIDEAIDRCVEDADFRWTVENTWQLTNWLRFTESKHQIKAFARLVRDGRIEIGAGWDDVRSSLFGWEDVNRFFYASRRLGERLGIAFRSVVMSDIPGHSWSYPQAMAKAGLKYFLAGINDYRHSAGTSIPLRDLPFYWEGPDGGRVLCWISFKSYTEGLWFWRLAARKYENMKQGVRRALQWYRGEGYRHDAVLVMLAHDCIGPAAAFCLYPIQSLQ